MHSLNEELTLGFGQVFSSCKSSRATSANRCASSRWAKWPLSSSRPGAIIRYSNGELQGGAIGSQAADAAPIWDGIVAKYALTPNHFSKVASFWHTDADLGREVEAFNDISRKLGFLDYQDTVASFTYAFDRLRAHRVIP